MENFVRCFLYDCKFISLAYHYDVSQSFPGDSVVKNPSASARDTKGVSLIHGLRRSPGGGHGNPLQYSCLENPSDRGAWQAIMPRVAKSWTPLKQFSTHVQSVCLIYWYLNIDLVLIPELNLTWSQYIILFKYSWIIFVNILLIWCITCLLYAP